MSPFTGAAVSFACAIASLYLAVVVCRRAGLVDSPGGRKQHDGHIPLAGGLAIVGSLWLSTLLLGSTYISSSFLGLTLLPLVIGLEDDRSSISPGRRLLMYYLCGLLLYFYADVRLNHVGNLLAIGNIPLLLLAGPLTALAVAGLCSAYNMIDGIDGLAAILSLIPLTTLWIIADSAGHPMTSELLLLIVPLLVFLVFNLGPDRPLWPKVFLGDSGSVTLGFIVTATLVYFAQGSHTIIRPVTALWLVTLPLMDMLATMLRRTRAGLNPMQGDSSHIHHLLSRAGLESRASLLLLAAYAVACAWLGVQLENTHAFISLLLYFLLFGSHCILVNKLHRRYPGSGESNNT